MQQKRISGIVQKFPGSGGWYFVALSLDETAVVKNKSSGSYGFIPVTAMLGTSVWKTSLLPGGKTLQDRYFIALKASVRKKEQISLGDNVVLTLTFDE